MDFLDIAQGRYYTTYTGKYFENSPFFSDKNNAPMIFDYEYIERDTKTYKHVIQNLTETESSDLTIKTRDQLGYKVGAHVSLEDGRMFTILQVGTDRKTSRVEAARLFSTPLDTEYILQLVEVDNPRGML